MGSAAGGFVAGPKALVETLRQRSHGDGVINTADIERLREELARA